MTVSVFCRFRPLGENEISSKSIELTDCWVKAGVGQVHYERPRYWFDRVFSAEASQERIFLETTLPSLDRCLAEGGSLCVLATGQTNSGKSFTIFDHHEQSASWGVLPRLLHHLVEHKKPFNLSIVEIYNEKIKDLLSGQTNVAMRNNQPLTKTVRQISESQEIKDVLAAVRRFTASTAMNQRSSRSHVLYTVEPVSAAPSGKEIRFQLVDLAGSEKVSRTEATGDRLEEAKSINKSLLALSNAVRSLAAEGVRGNFRDSKLTSLLKPSLTDVNCKIVFIATCSLAKANENETASTLRFAETTKHITRFDTPSVSLSTDSRTDGDPKLIERLRLIVQELDQCRILQAEKINFLLQEDQKWREKFFDFSEKTDNLVNACKLWYADCLEANQSLLAFQTPPWEFYQRSPSNCAGISFIYFYGSRHSLPDFM